MSDSSSTSGSSAAKRVRLSAPPGLGEYPPIVIKHRPATAVPGGIMRTLYADTPTPKTLEYFALQALGELPRLLLEATATPYDAVYHFDGAVFKAYAPHGQLPVYRGDELNGELLCEMGAIARHIARITSLDGNTIAEKANVDQLFELAQDLSGKKAGLHDPKHTDAPRVHMYLDCAETQAPETADGYWVGKSLTLADVAMFRILRHFSEIKERSLSSHPKLEAFVKCFAQRPEIADYLASDRRVPLTKNEIGDIAWAPDNYIYNTPLRESFMAHPTWSPPN